MGYISFSESVNSFEAKESGRFPLSYWKKGLFLEAAESLVSGEVFEKLKKVRWQVLKDRFLVNTEWHHTSSYYNRTEFYEVDEIGLSKLTVADVEELATVAAPKKAEPPAQRVRARYLVWSGTRKHPKAAEVEEDGEIMGNWFVSDTGTRKSITSRGFEIVKEVVEKC